MVLLDCFYKSRALRSLKYESSDSVEHQSLMKRGQRENLSDMTLGVKHLKKKKKRFFVNYNSDKLNIFFSVLLSFTSVNLPVIPDLEWRKPHRQ